MAERSKQKTSSNRGSVPPRLTVTIDEQLRRKIRIAAARADMEMNEWARVVLTTAARKTMERVYPDEV